MEPDTRPTRGEASAGDTLLQIGFADRGESRRLKWSGVATLCAHFLLFWAVIPTGTPYELEDAQRSLTVVRRYKPPKPPQPPQPKVRRTAHRVPIPDPTPDELEPIMSDETYVAPVTDAPTTDFLVGDPGSGPPDDTGAVEMDTAGLEPPRLLKRVDPDYDRRSARRGIQGATDIEIIIDPAGAVARARVINSSSDEELDRRAVEAVRQWRFSPATLEGSPVPVRAVVTINFRIY